MVFKLPSLLQYNDKGKNTIILNYHVYIILLKTNDFSSYFNLVNLLSKITKRRTTEKCVFLHKFQIGIHLVGGTVRDGAKL